MTEDYPTIRHLATRTGNHLAAECTEIVAELDRLRIVEATARAWVAAHHAEVQAETDCLGRVEHVAREGRSLNAWMDAVEAELAARKALIELLDTRGDAG